jgi:hypothetical protein
LDAGWPGFIRRGDLPADIVMGLVEAATVTVNPCWGLRAARGSGTLLTTLTPTTPPLPESIVDTTHPAHTSLLAWMWACQTGCPSCASPVWGIAPTFLRETSSLLEGVRGWGWCGCLSVCYFTGEKSTSVPQVLPPSPSESTLETLPCLEQGGHIQQGVLNMLPQPVGILEGETAEAGVSGRGFRGWATGAGLDPWV